MGRIGSKGKVWHPSFYLDFSKDFIWLEGGDLNFSSQELSLSKYIFSMARVLFGFTQDLFWSWRFLLFIWTQTKMFFFWKNGFWKFLWKKGPIAFGIILYHFQQFSLAMALVQIHSPNPSLTFGSWFTSNPASWTSPYNFFFHLNLIKTISVFYSSPWRFTKELPFLLWFLPPNQFPLLVL